MENYLAVLIVVFTIFRVVQQKFKEIFIVFLLTVHLCAMGSYTNLAWQTSIIHDKSSQEDDKSSQEKKK